MNRKHWEINRYWVIGVVFGLCFTIVLGRLFYLQVMRHEFYLAQAKEQNFGSIKLPAKRGEILVQDQRSGDYYKLATNVALDLLYVDPFLVTNERETSEKLAPIVLQTICLEITPENCIIQVQKYISTETIQEDGSGLKEVDPNASQEVLTKLVAENIYQSIMQKEVKTVVLRKFYTQTPEDEPLKAQVTQFGFDGITVTKSSITADPTRIRNKEEIATKLAPLLNFSFDDLAAKLTRRPTRYVPLADKLQPEASELVRALAIDGIVLQKKHFRFYPEKKLAAPVIGFFDYYAETGQYGIEGKFDPILRGEEGEIESENDLLGRHLVLRQGTIKAARDGDSVVLTIDRVVQAEIEQRLSKAVEDYKATSGQVLVMDPYSGEIIAMASYPTFDPNKYTDAYKTKEITFDPAKTMTVIKQMPNGNYLTYENKFGPFVFINHMVNSLYEPGSIFKPLTVAAGIDSGEITPRTIYHDTGEIDVDEYTIHNVSQACLGYNDMTHALEYSCNIGMAFIAKRLGKSLFYHYLTLFGFGERSDVELDGEAKGVLKYFRNWAASNLVTIGFGQGISVTPLQMGLAYATLANGGLLLQPHIVREIIHPDGRTEKSGMEVVRRVVSKDTADTVTAMLISAVENGVAKKAKLDKYLVAGKTGTSQIALEGRDGFEEGEGTTIASFAGYAPANNPKFVMIVKIDRPRSSLWGDATAAPVFKDVAEFLLDYYNIPPDR